MIGAVKGFAPVLIYCIGIFIVVAALLGKVRWSMLLIVFLMPLRNVVDRIQSMPLGKDFVDIVLIAMICGWVFNALGRKQEFLTKSPLNGLIIVLLAYTYVSLWNGFFYLGVINPFDFSDARVMGWKNFCILPLLYWLTLNNIRDRKWVWRIFVMMCITMALMDYYQVRQLAWYSSIKSRVKVSGTFSWLGPNEVAAFYNQYTILLMGVYFCMKRGIRKMLILGLIVINLYCVLFLFSRGAYAATFVGMFFLFVIKGKKWLIPLLLVAIYWQVALPITVKERIMMTTDEYGQLDASNEMRLIVWQQSIEAFKQNPVMGVGFFVFKDLGLELGDAHNIFLRILAEQGLIGILIFLAILLAFFREGWRLYCNGDDQLSRGLGLGFAMCIIVLFCNNMFGNRWTYLQLSSYLWIFAGLVSRLNIIAREEKKETERVPGRVAGQKNWIERYRIKYVRQ